MNFLKYIFIISLLKLNIFNATYIRYLNRDTVVLHNNNNIPFYSSKYLYSNEYINIRLNKNLTNSSKK